LRIFGSVFCAHGMPFVSAIALPHLMSRPDLGVSLPAPLFPSPLILLLGIPLTFFFEFSFQAIGVVYLRIRGHCRAFSSQNSPQLFSIIRFDPSSLKGYRRSLCLFSSVPCDLILFCDLLSPVPSQHSQPLLPRISLAHSGIPPILGTVMLAGGILSRMRSESLHPNPMLPQATGLPWSLLNVQAFSFLLQTPLTVQETAILCFSPWPSGV